MSAEGGKKDISFTPTPANDPAGVSHCASEAGHLIEKHVDLQNLLFLSLFIHHFFTHGEYFPTLWVVMA